MAAPLCGQFKPKCVWLTNSVMSYLASARRAAPDDLQHAAMRTSDVATDIAAARMMAVNNSRLFGTCRHGAACPHEPWRGHHRRRRWWASAARRSATATRSTTATICATPCRLGGHRLKRRHAYENHEEKACQKGTHHDLPFGFITKTKVSSQTPDVKPFAYIPANFQ